jgi:hypothetical protein
VGAVALELGFILFATGQRVPNLLQPGDFLHLLTAAGLALLVWYHQSVAVTLALPRT